MNITKKRYLNHSLTVVTIDEKYLLLSELDKILKVFKPSTLLQGFMGFFKNIYYKELSEYEISGLKKDERFLEGEILITKAGLDYFCEKNLEGLFFVWCDGNVYK